MKTKLVPIVLLVALTACNNGINYPNSPETDLIGGWTIDALVQYGESGVEEKIPSPTAWSWSKGSIMFLMKPHTIQLTYFNNLSSTYTTKSNNRITIADQWGGTEAGGSNDWENRLLQALNATNHWLVESDTLYLIFDLQEEKPYNAIRCSAGISIANQ